MATAYTDIKAHTGQFVTGSASTSLFAVLCQNFNTGMRWLLIKNKVSSFAANEAPDVSIPVPGANAAGTPGTTCLGADFFADGVPMPFGIAWGFSTDPTQFVAGTATDQITSITYG